MRKTLIPFLFVVMLCLSSNAHGKANSAPWFTPTTTPLKADIEEGSNFTLVTGGAYAFGKVRGDFLTTTPWETGLISRMPWIELAYGYAKNKEWEFGVQVPFMLVSSTLNIRKGVNENLSAGLKLGLFSSFHVTTTAYLSQKFFISLSPEIGLNQFGLAKGTTDLTVTPKRKFKESKLTMGGQLAVGLDLDPCDLGLIGHYAYAIGGEGIENSFFFDDVFMRHLFKISLAATF